MLHQNANGTSSDERKKIVLQGKDDFLSHKVGFILPSKVTGNRKTVAGWLYQLVLRIFKIKPAWG